MTPRRTGIGEAVSASILLAAAGVAAVVMIGGMGEQTQVSTDDMRSRLDVMRAQAVEQLDITSVSWGATGGGTGNMTFMVSNYGDHPTMMPFELYDMDGDEITNEDIVYRWLNNTQWRHCTTAVPCDPYTDDLPAKSLVRIVVMGWPDAGGGLGEPLIVVSDTGTALRVGDN